MGQGRNEFGDNDMKLSGYEFKDNRTHIMGILNVTDDSFSDGGKYKNTDFALYQAEKMINEGAVIIDVGGESTRPGYTPIGAEEEIYRVVPVIERIKKNFNIMVSVDTQKGSVCYEAAKVGADMINDIWGFKKDKDIVKCAKEFNLSACLMHNRDNGLYKDLVNDVISDLKESVNIARENGINDIIIDPGIGFSKSYEENIEVMRNIEKLKVIGYPMLLGVSNKSVIGTTLNKDVSDRLIGTVSTSVYAAMKGCNFVRVHNVKENKEAIDMVERIIGYDN